MIEATSNNLEDIERRRAMHLASLLLLARDCFKLNDSLSCLLRTSPDLRVSLRIQLRHVEKVTETLAESLASHILDG